jgi:hypothetical protein
MRPTFWTAIVVAAGAGLLSMAGSGITDAAPALKDAAAGEWPGPDAAIFLGCGEVQGEGTVVQLDRTGNVLGTISLSNTPYGLAADRAGLVAALPGLKTGRVVRIGRTRKVETLIEDLVGLPAPIGVAADPATGDVLVADNAADVLLLLPGGKAKDARQILAIKGHEGHLQDMSIAFAKDGHLLFGGTGPVGVYRFAGGTGAAMGDPLLAERGAVAADPASKRWAAALEGSLHVFEGNRELTALAYPNGKQLWHETLAFGPGGAPILALHLGGNRFEVVQADLDRKTFRTLFEWDKSRVVSLAIGPKLNWKD